MKSKYLFTLFLIGILPVAAMLGVYGWIALQTPPAAVTPVSGPALHATTSALQTQDLSLASSIKAAIESTYQDVAKLVANHTDTDLSNFVASHPGVASGGGLAIFSAEGKLLKSVPATAQLADPGYGGSDEFRNMMAKFKENGGSTYLFYTRRLNYPAFVFSVPLDSHTVAQAVLNLSSFFGTVDPRNGEISLIDADSGQYFYNSSPSKMQAGFNPGQDPWLAKIQAALAAKQSGSLDSNPPNWVAIYTSLGLKSFGMVRLVPFAMLQPTASKANVQASSPIESLQEIFTGPTGMPLLIAAAACLGWVFLVGLLQFGSILSPLRKASTAVLNAAKGVSTLTPEAAKKFGGDEVGQMVQASAMLLQKLQDDKRQAEQEKEEALRKGRSEVDAKNREASGQVSAAQQQAQSAKNELSGLNQQLNDKLKELEAMKSMSEGLRSQTEQAKAEIGKLKSQVTAADDAKAAAQKQLAQTQAQLEDQLKEMEAKLLSTVAASSAIQVSSVRAAAIRTMSDELKTTLGIIKGYVSSALGTAAGGINEKQQEFLGMVINRSARLEKFINDLVDIYQVEIEHEKAVHEDVNLASEIEGLAFNFQAQADVKGIKMKVEAKGTVPKVPVVRRRFNQLWNILYLQIIKDAPRGSSIPISVESIGESVKVTVQDPGLTVATEALPRLFDEFYDPKHTASPQLAGTGLKFALIKTILAANGGGAVAEKADPGTRLILTFPTKIKKPGEAPLPGPKIALSPAPGAAPSFGAPKQPVPPPLGATRPVPPVGPAAAGSPPAPGFGGQPGLPRPGLTPPVGMPKSPSPLTPAAASAPSMGAGGAGTGPKPPSGTSGLLDSLMNKVPPVTAPGIKPPVAPPPGPAAAPQTGAPTAPPAAPRPAGAASMGILGSAPKPPAAPGAPGLTPPPLGSKPAATPGLLDSLIDKKPPVAPAPGPPAAPPAGSIPRPVAAPPVPGAAVPKPAAPPVPGAAPGAPAVGGLPKPPVPGAPAAPGMAPKPLTPSGIPSPVAPGVSRPPMPGMPGPAPGVPAAPKVVPTNLKPTTPPPGVLDLDAMMDGMKLDAGAPKPAAAPAPARPPVPGAPPMGIPGAPKAPAPGVPPGGLDASKAQQKAKDGEGELIE